MAEEWRSVVGFVGLYEVSNQGRTRSVDRVVTNKNGVNRKFYGKEIRQKISNAGYFEVCLCKNGKLFSKLVHRLVAEAFLGQQSDSKKCYIDHINGIKTDNRLENLRYVTPSENREYAIELGSVDIEKMREISRKNGRNSSIGKLNAKPVIRSDGQIFSSASEAARAIGANPESVKRVARGERHTCHGYTFKFVEQAS